MAYKEELSLVITEDPKLESVLESYVIYCSGIPVSETNFSKIFEIWSSNKTELQELVLQLTRGTTVNLFGHQHENHFRMTFD